MALSQGISRNKIYLYFIVLKPSGNVMRIGWISYREWANNGSRWLVFAYDTFSFLYLAIPFSFLHRFSVDTEILSIPFSFITATFSISVFEQS